MVKHRQYGVLQPGIVVEDASSSTSFEVAPVTVPEILSVLIALGVVAVLAYFEGKRPVSEHPVQRPNAGRFGRRSLHWDVRTVAIACVAYLILSIVALPPFLPQGEDFSDYERLRILISERPEILFFQVFLWIPVVFVFCNLVNRGTSRDLGLRFRGKVQGILEVSLRYYMQIMAALGGLVFFLAVVSQVTGWMPSSAPEPTLVILEEASIPVFFGLAVLLGPFGEELFFRAMMYPAFARRIGTVWAYLLSGMLFALAHPGQGMLGFVLRTALGAYLAWCYERTGVIYVPFLVHGLYNGTLFLLYRLVV